MSSSSLFELSGDLNASDIARIFQRTRAACRDGDLPRRLDLSQLGQTDSSALALMLDWQSHARAHQASIEFSSPPNSLRVLAGLSQVAELLGWDIDGRVEQDGEPS